VYIEPMGSYETYLAAAFAKEHVPVTVVANGTKADYVITSTLSQTAATSPLVVVNNQTDTFQNGFNRGWGSHGSTTASISVIDVRTSAVGFAYSVGKGPNTNRIQSTAEACAKHLKEFIARGR
jgi:hypothetical protein